MAISAKAERRVLVRKTEQGNNASEHD